MIVTVFAMPDCPPCEELALHWNKLRDSFPAVRLRFVDLLADQASAARYCILASPGIVVDDKLVHQGGISRKGLASLLSAQLKQGGEAFGSRALRASSSEPSPCRPADISSSP